MKWKRIDIETNCLTKFANPWQTDYMAYWVIFGFISIILWLIHECVSCDPDTFVF